MNPYDTAAVAIFVIVALIYSAHKMKQLAKREDR